MTGPVTDRSDPVTVLQHRVLELEGCLAKCQHSYSELMKLAEVSLREHAELHRENKRLRSQLAAFGERLLQATTVEEILRRAAQSPPRQDRRPGLRLINGSASGVLGLMLAISALAPGPARPPLPRPRPAAAVQAPIGRGLACEAIPAFTGHTAG